MQHPPFIIFTDLDGTLLDHYSYQAKQAVPALEALKKAAIPLVFCSSKTFDEQRFYQKKLGVNGPLVVENGSAIYFPEHFFPGRLNHLPKTVGGFFYHNFAHLDIRSIRSILSEIAIEYKLPLAGYANSDQATLMAVTGLKPMALKRARNRHFTETLHRPTLLEPDVAQFLSNQLEKHDLVLVKGGRFWSVQSKFAGKGHALLWFKKLLSEFFKPQIPICAIGDSANDLPMLQAADQAFLVKKAGGSWEPNQIYALHKIDQSGPDGFTQVILKLLQEQQTAPLPTAKKKSR